MMSLINSLRSDDSEVSLKWMFCEECRMEWLVPDIPDAIPGHCPHCTRPVDTTLEPADVLADVEYSNATREGDISFDAVQRTILAIDDDVHVRTYPIEELQDLDGEEVIACGHRLELLISKATSVSLDIPNETLLRLLGYLFKYVAVAGYNLEAMMEDQNLRQFRRFKSIREWSKEENGE
jgi:copper chaperone CopZ